MPKGEIFIKHFCRRYRINPNSYSNFSVSLEIRNMNEQNDLQNGFYLENWYIEPHLGNVTGEHRTVRLEPKIMDVLVCMAERQGEVIKKEDFFRKTWSDVNVTPHVLARAISEIRRTFHDEPHNPRFIQTVPKIGYRLIAHVSAGGCFTEDFATSSEAALPRNYLSQVNFAQLLILLVSLGALFLFFGILVLLLMTGHGAPHS